MASMTRPDSIDTTTGVIGMDGVGESVGLGGVGVLVAVREEGI